MVFVYLLMALLGVAASIFAIQNPEMVAVRFLVWSSVGMPLSLVILLSAFVGIVFAAVTGFAKQIQQRMRIRQLESQLAQLLEARRADAEAARMRAPAPVPVAAPPPPPPGLPPRSA